MKNKLMTGIVLTGLMLAGSLHAQHVDAVPGDDTTTKTASPKTLPKYAAVNGYHAGNYKQHAKAGMVPLKTNLISAEASDKKVISNYKMPHNQTEVKKVSAPKSGKKTGRNYKMPFNN